MARRRWVASARGTNPETILSTGLNNLANDAGAQSSAISNDAADELDLYMDLELLVTFGTSPNVDTLVEVFVVRTVDGSNYETSSDEGRPRLGYVGGFAVDNVTSQQRLILPGIPIPPRDFQVRVINRTGQAFPASGSTVRACFYSEQVV